jgi:membrane protease YdiL (CAAX protease family)
MVFVSDYAHRPLFEFSFNLTSQTDSFEVKFLVISLYLVCVPIQELVVRGALQSTMQEVLVGRYNTFWAIILSNLLFSDVHTYISIGFGLLVFLPGLFWGWLYSRHRNLIGVSVSHIIVGAWAIFVVGLL